MSQEVYSCDRGLKISDPSLLSEEIVLLRPITYSCKGNTIRLYVKIIFCFNKRPTSLPVTGNLVSRQEIVTAQPNHNPTQLKVGVTL